jgi:hypothetical protein
MVATAPSCIARRQDGCDQRHTPYILLTLFYIYGRLEPVDKVVERGV